MSAKDRIQERYSAFVAALEASPAMQPYAHDLRVLLDPAPLSQRITAAVREHRGALTALSTRDQTGALQARLALKLTQTSLENVPSVPAIRSRLEAMKKDEKQTPSISQGSSTPRHATTTRST